MELKELTLKNIRSYETETIRFPTGSVLLSGDIGSGKSTILHAVEFALFGVRRDLSGDALLRKGSVTGEVELKFLVSGKEVEIKRRLKRGSNGVSQDTGQIIISGERTELTTTELKAKVLGLLGYPAELLTKSKSLIYRYTVYTPQEEMKQIIYDSPENRVDTLRKVFGIDRYKRIADNAALFAKKMRDVRRGLEGGIIDLPEKEKKLTKEKELHKIIHAKRAEVVGTLELLRKEKEEREKTVKRLEEEQKRCEDILKKKELLDTELTEVVRQRSSNMDEISRAKEDLQKHENELSHIEYIEKDYPETADVESEARIIETKVKDARERRAGLLERKESMEVRLAENKVQQEEKKRQSAQIPEKQKILQELQETIKDKQMITESLKDMDRLITEKEKEIEKYKTLKRQSELLKEKITTIDKCPTCKQQVSEEHKKNIVSDEDEKIEKISREIDQIEEQKKEIVEKIEDLRKSLEEFEQQEHKITQIKTEMKGLESQEEEIRKMQEMQKTLDEKRLELIKELDAFDEGRIEEMEKELEDKKKLLKEISEHKLIFHRYQGLKKLLTEKNNLIVRLTEQNDELKKRVQSINKQKMELPQTDIDVEKLKRAKQETADVTAQERETSIRFAEMTKELEGHQGIIDMMQKEIVAMHEKKAQIERLSEIDNWVEQHFVKLMQNMERHVMLKIHQEFDSKFTGWFKMLIEDDDLNIRLDDSFCPLVEQNGHETSIEYLSGGEKTAVALSYRLALNKTVNDVVDTIKTKDLLILDEPTDGFSNEQLDRVRDVLEELGTKQIVMVSHEGKIESMVNNVIRIEKNSHVSKVMG